MLDTVDLFHRLHGLPGQDQTSKRGRSVLSSSPPAGSSPALRLLRRSVIRSLQQRRPRQAYPHLQIASPLSRPCASSAGRPGNTRPYRARSRHPRARHPSFSPVLTYSASSCNCTPFKQHWEPPARWSCESACILAQSLRLVMRISSVLMHLSPSRLACPPYSRPSGQMQRKRALGK